METASVNFKKIQGTGNDFVVIDNRDYHFYMKELIELAPKICNRRLGVGADGLLVLNHPQIDGLDYTMIYRNADGSDAGMCGNGARCLALFAYKRGFGEQHTFNVHQNIYRAVVDPDSREVEVAFPVSARVDEISLDEQTLYRTHTGTEHVVKLVEEEKLGEESLLKKEGRSLRMHNYFHPVGTNVNFICGTDNSKLLIQTYERGVEDLTLACGTGAIASSLVWHHIRDKKSAENNYTVETRGGNLSVAFSFDPVSSTYSDIKLKGEAKFVFEGLYYQ